MTLSDGAFAQLGKNGRLAKDYEALPDTTAILVYLAMIRLVLRRLRRGSPKAVSYVRPLDIQHTPFHDLFSVSASVDSL